MTISVCCDNDEKFGDLLEKLKSWNSRDARNKLMSSITKFIGHVKNSQTFVIQLFSWLQRKDFKDSSPTSNENMILMIHDYFQAHFVDFDRLINKICDSLCIMFCETSKKNDFESCRLIHTILLVLDVLEKRKEKIRKRSEVLNKLTIKIYRVVVSKSGPNSLPKQLVNTMYEEFVDYILDVEKINQFLTLIRTEIRMLSWEQNAPQFACKTNENNVVSTVRDNVQKLMSNAEQQAHVVMHIVYNIRKLRIIQEVDEKKAHDC